MTYLDRLKKIEKKMSVLRVGIAECEREYSELLCDMAEETTLKRKPMARAKKAKIAKVEPKKTVQIKK